MGVGPVRAWTSLLVPSSCPGCGALDEVVCPGCRERVLRGPLLVRPLVDGTVAVASAPWRGPARGLVVAAKESGRRDVGDVLAQAVARAVVRVAWDDPDHPDQGDPDPDRPEAWRGASCGPRPGPLLLVPPPSRTWAVLRRGSRPTTAMAQTTARLLRAAGADVQALDLLVHTRRVRDQAGLTRAERAENLSGAVALRRAPATVRDMAVWNVAVRDTAVRDVVVVDDVMTTGATVLQCAQALRDAGLCVLGAALVACV